MKSVLITGINGQDGIYLSRALMDLNFEIIGVIRPGSPVDERLLSDSFGAESNIRIVEADLSNPRECVDIVNRTNPDIVFHLAAVSSVALSWKDPLLTSQVNGMSATALMTSLYSLQEKSNFEKKFVNASSGEIFAGSNLCPQDELTALSPRSPYGVAKCFSHQMVHSFREKGLHATNAIFYSHESPIRSNNFVTRKITQGVARIALGLDSRISLGNLDAVRDWGWAPDFTNALVRMAEQSTSADYVVATGEGHTVREFVQEAFRAANIEDWEQFVSVDLENVRPADSNPLIGSPAKAMSVLGWEPSRQFGEIVASMVENDLALLQR